MKTFKFLIHYYNIFYVHGLLGLVPLWNFVIYESNTNIDLCLCHLMTKVSTQIRYASTMKYSFVSKLHSVSTVGAYPIPSFRFTCNYSDVGDSQLL